MTIKTTNLVQASAQILTVTEIKRGNAVKRLAKNYADAYRVVLGVVLDVMHNGTDAAFTVLEFDNQFGKTDVEVKTYGTDSDLKLFHASPEEVAEGMNKALENARKSVKEKQRELDLATEVLRTTERAKEMAIEGGISEAVYKVVEA